MSTKNSAIHNRFCDRLVTVAGVALLGIAPAIAQVPSGGGQQQPTSPSQQTSPASQPGMSPMDQAANQGTDPTAQMMDKAFVRNALQGGMAEVELGKLALQKSNNPDVKQFAQRMVDDHTKMGDEMKQVAQQMNVKAPDAPSNKDKSGIAKMQALTGDDFDKAYIKDMVKDHEKDQKEFRQEAQSATDPNLKQVAAQGTQVIGQHLQMIQQIAQKNNVVASR